MFRNRFLPHLHHLQLNPLRFEKAGMMEAAKSAKIFTQDARTPLTIGIENKRLIIICIRCVKEELLVK